MSYVEQSFENAVHFYREELIQIDKGNSDALNECKKRTLRNHGILTVIYDPYKKTVLSPKARSVLERLLEEERE